MIKVYETIQKVTEMRYNRNDALSIDELGVATGIPKNHLTQVLAILVKAKILHNEEEGQYDLNPGEFSSNLPVKGRTNLDGLLHRL